MKNMRLTSPPLPSSSVSSSVPVDPLWEQVEPTRVQLLANLQEEIYIDGDPCGTGSARYLQNDVQRVHQYEGKQYSKQQRFSYLYFSLKHLYNISMLLLLFVFLLFSIILGRCQWTAHSGLALARSRSFQVPSKYQQWLGICTKVRERPEQWCDCIRVYRRRREGEMRVGGL